LTLRCTVEVGSTTGVAGGGVYAHADCETCEQAVNARIARTKKLRPLTGNFRRCVGRFPGKFLRQCALRGDR
jgi:hypothetical protein